MSLVGYASDSEDSDNEAPPAPTPAVPKPAGSKPAFQKVVDRSNSSKIRLNLPSLSSEPKEDDIDADAPPAKKARTGGGAFSGFNALLPAPKRSGQPAGGTGSSSTGVRRGSGRGLGAGISLKTGATPAFSREPVSEPEVESDLNGNRPTPAPPAEELPRAPPPAPQDAQETKPAPKPMMFRPLSVATKKQKKRKGPIVPPPSAEQEATTVAVPAPSLSDQKPAPPPKPKVSLFSISTEESSALPAATTGGEYKPLLYQTQREVETREEDGDIYPPTATSYATPPTGAQQYPTSASTQPQSLHDIAADLNLSAAARRQLFGRNAPSDAAAINIVNFNTDAEYAANEELRASGQTVQHNPVRAIAPGKHSLKQLVNNAATQKEALEEHFAQGARNRKEAGRRYGW